MPINLLARNHFLVCNNYFSIFGASSEVMNNSIIFLLDKWVLLNDTLGLVPGKEEEAKRLFITFLWGGKWRGLWAHFLDGDRCKKN